MTDERIWELAQLNIGYDRAVRPLDFARAIERELEAARATAGQSRNAVIEECCAAIKSKDDLAADDNYMLDSNDCIRVCRALKSQQDAAIESQRSGDGS